MLDTRPVLVDLCCAGGGASVGYERAGFRVIGVDVKPQPRYPLEFIRADVLDFLADRDRWSALGVVAWGASPPCFANTVLRNIAKIRELGHVDIIPEVRAGLEATGLPYVLENVPGADMRVDLELCGTMFGLGARCRDDVYRELRRHRWFESNVPLVAPGPCRHVAPAIGVHGSGPGSQPRQPRAVEGRGGYNGTPAEKREAMGIGWLPYRTINLAIPPAYTEWIGRTLITALRCAA